jgi:BASS family bile acid:Na+ symporter
MSIAGRVFRNRNFILILAIVLGLAIGEQGASLTQSAVVPLLALVMTLSMSGMTTREFTSIRTMPRRILVALLLTYVVTGGVLILMGRWLIHDDEILAGLIVLAAVPPAIASVPWSYVLGGDTLFSLIALMASYLVAMVVTPAIMMTFLGITSYNPIELLILLGQLIVLPIAISRILIATRVTEYIARWKNTVANWSFFVVIFTVIGLNRQAFFTEPDILLRLSIIAVVVSFGLSYIIEYGARALHVKQETVISLILVGTMKNFGLASGILLALFSERAAIPSSIMVIFFLLRTLWLGFHFKK